MTIDPTLLPGLLLLAVELLALVAFGYIVTRVALRQHDDKRALAQALIIGPSIWVLILNFILNITAGRNGAIISWVVVLLVSFVLAKRASTLLPRLRHLAGFIGAFLVLFWIMLAARQLMKIPDPGIHLGLSSYFQAGGWPPATPWNPDIRVHYHHGVDLLIGMLAPPMGPNFVLVTEVVGAYIWASFALIVAVELLSRAGWLWTITLSPLLLTAASWTLLGYLNRVPNIVQIPLPTELHTIGLRDSLGKLYWPELEPVWHSEFDGSPANIWKPLFVLSYALTFIILSQVAGSRSRSLMDAVTLAVLVGYLGIVGAELALLVLGLWCGLEAWRLLPRLVNRDIEQAQILKAAAGPLGALLLLAVGGGVLTGMLTSAPRGHLSLGWIDDPFSRQIFGRYEPLQGRIGLLGIGAISAAALAALLAWRDRFVVALSVGTVPLMIAALVVRYSTAPLDVSRFDGHARNFALLALLLAVAKSISSFKSRWRYGASIIAIALVVWPTIARPIRTLGLGASRGVNLTNPLPGVLAADSNPLHHDLQRYVINTPMSEIVASYIHDNTSVDTRIFSPHPHAMSIATGRPNASGFIGHLHQEPVRGPEYDDIRDYFEPGAVRRLGFDYIHATHAWTLQLPNHAQDWLDDPRMFEQLVSTETDALYRVKPAFLQLAPSHTPESFESLRQSGAMASTVLLAPGLLPKDSLKLAMALSHSDLIGHLDPVGAHLLTALPPTSALGTQKSDFVVLPARTAPSAFDPAARRPLWWNGQVAIYAAHSIVPPLMRPPPRHFSVRLSDVRTVGGHIAFTATFTDRATDLWSGQDWVVVATDDSLWRLPYRFGTANYTSAFVRWFDGQVQPVPETDTHEYFFLYEFDPRTGTLALWDGSTYTSLSAPHSQLQPGNWMLAARPNINRKEVGLIPVLHFTLARDGTFTYKVYEGSLDAMLVR